MKKENKNTMYNSIDNISIYDEISDEARAIIDSARLLSGDDESLFYAHIKYFTDSPVILKEVNRILNMMKKQY